MVRGQITATVDWNEAHQRIDGFGGCSAWMNGLSTSSADLLFSTSGSGIGLSLLRARIAPGASANTGETSIMQQAVARGARVWSAPWSPQASYKTNNDVNNGGYLLASKYQTYANDLANYVYNMKNTYGVSLYAISINNEPTARPSFESCLWTAQQMHDFVPILYNALVAKGVSSTKIMLPEHQHWDMTLANRTMADPTTAAMVGILAAHDYAGSGPGPLTSLTGPEPLAASGKAVWETEFSSDTTINTISLAEEIHYYMVSAEASAWHTWWIDNSTNSSILRNGALTTQSCAIGNYSKFVRPNYYRIGVSNPSGALISAYKDWQSPKFAIVAANLTDADIVQTFSLAGASTISSVVPYITSTTQMLVAQSPVTVASQSFTYTLPKQSVVTFSGQGQANLGPNVTPLAPVTINANHSTAALGFTVSNPSVTITGSSSNPALVSNGSIAFLGSGTSRTVTVTPLPNQTGTATISVIVTSSTASTVVPFLLTVTPEPVSLADATAIASGDFGTASTWGVAPPVPGDANTWRSGAKTISMATNPSTFYGGTLVVEAGGKFAPGKPGAGVTLNNLTLNGGVITMGNNLGMCMNLTGKSFLLNSGTLKTGSADSMDVVIENASLAGNGSIDVVGTGTSTSTVQIMSSVQTQGFTGVFRVHDFGVLDLPTTTPGQASFGVSLSGTAKLATQNDTALTTLVISGSILKSGTYSYASFSAAQQAFVGNGGSTITVVGPAAPPAISAIADTSIAANTSTGPIAFTLAEDGIDLSALKVTGSSSNTTLVPNANIVFGGTDANRTVTITPAVGQTGITTVSIKVSDGTFSTTETLVLTVKAISIGAIADQSARPASILAVPFTVGDVNVPANQLLLSANSSNAALVSGISFSGAGASKVALVATAPSQTGTSTISITVSDGLYSATSAFQLTVTGNLSTIVASGSGAINSSSTWGGTAAPVVGDTSLWQTGPYVLSMGAVTETFYGETFEIVTSGSFAPKQVGPTLTLNHLKLNGGTVGMGNNSGLTLDLTGHQLTLLSGTLKSGNGSSMWMKFKNASLAGGGLIHVTSAGANGSYVEILSGVSTIGFNGTFSVHDNGNLKLPAIATDNASFGAKVSSPGVLQINAGNVALTSLVLGADTIAPGSYGAADFTAAQLAFLTITTGTITVVDTPPTISPISDRGIAVNGSTGAIAFTVGDGGTAAGSLALTATASNTGLLPNGAVVFGGTGANRTVTVTPAANTLGSSTITVNVSDGNLSATTSFLLTVTGTPIETWRFANFGSTAATGSLADLANSDGDAWTNYQEYLLGTNPNSQDSAALLRMVTVGSQITLSFDAIPATGPGYTGLTRVYEVESTGTIADPASWTTLSTFTTSSGPGQVVTVTDTLGAGPRFYRLRVHLQ